MEENKQIQLLDVLGLPTNIILFSHKAKTLIYSLGSNIVHYNLKKDSKTFLQYLQNDIMVLKFLDETENQLLIIDKSSFPVLSIWELPSFLGIHFQEIITQDRFEVSKIFFEQIDRETFLILITSVNNINFLYTFHLLENNKFDIKLFKRLSNIITEIRGFKVFYNSNDIVFLMNNNLQYYYIDFQHNKCLLKKNFNFSFKLLEDSLRLSIDVNLLCFLTAKGNCLVYDQNGNNKPSINPPGSECFTTCEFFGDSLCFGSSHGNIYVYNIYEFHLKYKISFNNENINNIDYNSDKAINKIFLNEKLDQIFIKYNDTCFSFQSIKNLLYNTKYNNYISKFKINNDTIFNSNSHSKKITDICNYNPNTRSSIEDGNDPTFYTCAVDQKFFKYSIEGNTDKLRNKSYNIFNFNNKYQANHSTKNYLTAMQFHPLYNFKLYAGDNKGMLYIINILNNVNMTEFKKYLIGNFEIVSLSFSYNGSLLCVGFETGHLVIYKTKQIFECVIQLNDHFLSINEIEIRKNNNNILAYCKFFTRNKINKHCLIYTKSQNVIEYSKLYLNEDKITLNQKKILSMKIKGIILDIRMHTSENYLIILNNKKRIIINSINKNKTVGIIDLSTQVKNIYNFELDNSGLYLGIICDLNNNKNKNDLILIEINTSKVKSVINKINPISKIKFDTSGRYLIVCSERGTISLWRLHGEMTAKIRNFLNEMQRDINFFEKYEINYTNKKHINYDDYSIFTVHEKNKNYSDDINEEIIEDDVNNNFFAINNNFFNRRNNLNVIKSNDLNIYKNNKLGFMGKSNINKINPMSFNNRYKINEDKRCNTVFWSHDDTKKLLNSKLGEMRKYPEPEDIDAFLVK